MPEIVQSWLGTRLGIVLDMSPQNFGKNTKDAKIMAKLLHSFGVMPVHVLEKIKESKNFYECYNNWIILQPWLKHIGVMHDNETLERIAGGEGSAAISLFYSVYLNLEKHDRLHYISAQKERRFSEIKWGEKFKVDLVPESAIRNSMGDTFSKLAHPFFQKCELIEWHREKCKEVIENINKTKKKFVEVQKKKHSKLGPIKSKFTTSQPIDQRLLEAQEITENITVFEKKHPQECQNLTYSELIKQQHDSELQPCLAVPNLSLATKMINDLKRRKKSEVYTKNFAQKMQLMVLDEEWKKISEKQNQNFEEMVCKNLLKQSQYEKQMANKLYQLRLQKKILAENRSIIENLKMDQRDKEFNDRLALKMEYRGEYLEEAEFQKEKILELHKRMYANKIKSRMKFLRNECQDIVHNFTDIAIKVSGIREHNSCKVPKALMKDMKELFFKNLPIFDNLENLEELYEFEESLNEIIETEGEESGQDIIAFDENYKSVKNHESYRQSMLDECDFFDYHNLTGPWMIELFFPESDETEIKQNVLGYIVHKILEIKYPISKLPPPAPIKLMKRTCIVQDLEDEACKMLTELMELRKILVVRVEDAINFVLSAYKQEASTTNVINENLKNITRSSLKKKENSKKDINKKLLLLKKEEAYFREHYEEQQEKEDVYILDKETQTSDIMSESGLLSPNAEIGKAAFEALYLGEPVPDPVIVCAIVAYVISKQSYYDGWILVNYPRLYTQASDLESALTGCKVLPDVNLSQSLEDLDDLTYVNPVVSPFNKDDFIKNRTSLLVPKFYKDSSPPEKPTSYFNIFLKLKKLGSYIHEISKESNSNILMEQFYLKEKILRVLDYDTQNFQTVKNIGKNILDEVNELGEVVSKTSLDIFGKGVLELNEKWVKTKRKTSLLTERDFKKEPKTVKQLEMEKIESYSTFHFDTLETHLEEVGDNFEVEKNLDMEKIILKDKENVIPGDPDWEWAEGFQPKELLLALATLWENMETVYIEDLKHVFFSLRVHRLNILSYCDFVNKSRRSLMRRKDDKQNVLEEFQKKFNAIEEDARFDVDVKTELYVRVAEMEEILMGMADDRKKNSFNYMREVAYDNWVPNEMSNLVNIFLTCVQLEIDRCINTCQVINDYYLSLQQIVPNEKPIEKIVVPKLLGKDEFYSAASNYALPKGSLNQSAFSRAKDLNRFSKYYLENGKGSIFDKISKSRHGSDKKQKSTESFQNKAAEAVAEILMNLSFSNGSTTPFHDFFKETISNVTTETQNLLNNYIAEAQKGNKRISKSNKKDSDINTANNNLKQEWKAALENELARFLFRVKLILAKGIFDMNEFLTTILNTFSALVEEINAMYCKETQSISDCCKIFRCSIEEEMPIQPQLVLKGDEFYVNKDVFLFDKRSDYSRPLKKQQITTFNVKQLSLLFEKLQRVAPDGEIIKRSLLFILEDLRAFHYEISSCHCFPESWKLIEPEDMTLILNEIYLDLEIVNWKDFIIYALDLPVPSEEEILTMRNSFKSYDSLSTELIIWENFNKVCFWFESSFYSSGQENLIVKVKKLLFRMYQIDENRSNYSALLLAFCKDENPIHGFAKALALATGKKIRINESKSENSSMVEEYEIFEDEAFEESDKTTSKKPLCCLSPSAELTLKCIPKEKIFKCDCGDTQQNTNTEEEVEEEKLTDNAGENDSIFYQDSLGYPYGSVIVSVVPCELVSSVLRASFPSLPQLSILLDCKETFQETLNSIYNSLEYKNGKIDIFDLIQHKFVSRLLLTTNKFKFIKLQKIFEIIFNAKNSVTQSSIDPSRLYYNSFA